MTSGQAVMQHGSCSSWSGFAHSIAPTHPSSFLHITLTHPYTHAYMHTHTRAHAHMHTHTHAHTQTHSYQCWHTNRHSTCSYSSAHSRQTFKRTLILGTLKKSANVTQPFGFRSFKSKITFGNIFSCWIRQSRSRYLRKKDLRS